MIFDIDDARELPPFCCAVCHHHMDHVVTLGDPRMPKPGDLTICAYCLSIGVFLEDGQLRPATSKECEVVPDELRSYLALMTDPHRKPS